MARLRKVADDADATAPDSALTSPGPSGSSTAWSPSSSSVISQPSSLRCSPRTSAPFERQSV
jgi:hypothetical protein